MPNNDTFEDWKARRAAHERCHNMIVGSAFAYVLFTMTFVALALADYRVADIYLEVDVLFRIFPFGLLASFALLAAFNLYDWITD